MHRKLSWTRAVRTLALLFVSLSLWQCAGSRKVNKVSPQGLSEELRYTGTDGFNRLCSETDSIQSMLHTGATAILEIDGIRYEAGLTAYVERDSLIYLSFIHSGFEIIRAAVTPDSLRVIDRTSKIVYHTKFNRRLGHDLPVNYYDLQSLLNSVFRCDWATSVRDSGQGSLILEKEVPDIMKRIHLNASGLAMQKFEFNQHLTGAYLMGEELPDAFKIYTNIILGKVEAKITRGNTEYNRKIKVRTEVSAKKYSFIEIR